MSLDYDLIIKRLSKLSNEELAKLSGRVAALRSLRGQSTSVYTDVSSADERGSDFEADDFLQIICNVILRKSGELISPVALRRAPQYKAFSEKAASLSGFLEKNTGSRVSRRSILSIGFQLLYDNLTAQGLPASARTLMQHAHRIPSVIDAAFPGYAASGLLYLVTGDLKEEV